MRNYYLIIALQYFFVLITGCNPCDKVEKEILDSFSYRNFINEYPNKVLTQEYSNAINQHQKFHRVNTQRDNKWSWIGPDNIHGRVLSLALNPKDTSELWAGTASSGLWKSVSGGIGNQAWVNVKLPIPVLSISSIAIDPIDPNIIYLGTGESYSYNSTDGGKNNRVLRGSWGIGILKSTDGGQTWNLALDWSKHNDRCIWKIIIDPKNHDIVYASGTHGIFKSSDKGASWNETFDKKMTNDLIIHPDSCNILLAAVGGIGSTDFGIYKTSDFGSTWTKIAPRNNTISNGRIMLTINSVNPNKVFALISDTFNTLSFISTNSFFKNFTTHSIQDVSSYQGWYAKGLVSNDSGKEILVGGVDLFIDRSGTFNNFTRYQMGEIGVHSDFHDIIVNPLDHNKVYFATDGGVFRSDNFGQTFYSCNDGLNNSQFYSASFSSDGLFAIGGLQDNRSAIYNHNLSWNSTHYGDGTASVIHPQNIEIILCSSQNLYLSRTTNRAKDWQTILVDDSAPFVTSLEMSKIDPNIIFTGSNKLYRSLDNGLQFKIINEMPSHSVINKIELSPNNINELLFSTLPTENEIPKLYYSSNSGISFTEITSNLPERIISDISMLNEEKYFVCLTGFGSSHIYVTSNSGKDWLPIDSNLPDIPYHTIWVNPTNHENIFIGSDLGLYSTRNGGRNWELSLPNDLDVLPVYDLKYIKNEKKLAVVTHGKGIYFLDISDLITSLVNADIKTSLSENIILWNDNFANIPHFDSGYIISIDGSICYTIHSSHQLQTSKLPKGIYFLASKDKIFKLIKL